MRSRSSQIRTGRSQPHSLRARSALNRIKRKPVFENLEDRLVLSALQFDFGPATSPVATGYTAVATPAFSSTLGYGWQTASSVSTGVSSWPSAERPARRL